MMKMTMISDIIILIIVFLFCIIHPLWRWYEPKIEAVALVEHYRIYLWYNSYNGTEYKGRVYKYLFEI